MRKRILQLGAWLVETMASSEPIIVSGGLRGSFEPTSALIPALELSGPLATTVRVLVPSPPAQEKSGSSATFQIVKNKQGKEDAPPTTHPESFWWNGWTKVFTASALFAPRCDAVRLADLLQDRRVIRLFCDTNALASGVAEWFLHVLPSGTQLISSAIADKEIMSWADRYKGLYDGVTVEYWEARLRFLLARRLTEYPPQHTVIDRLSPDQNALMLAQGTSTEGGKSSQGDLLFVELARPLIREQPRQARVVFLTGDANVARAATSALGPEHVLYANPDSEGVRAAAGQVLPRGFWHPTGPLGALSLPSSSRLLWNLLSAFAFLVLKQGTRQWVLESIYSVRHGGPSDWADPWVRIQEFPNQPTEQSTPTPSVPEAGPIAVELQTKDEPPAATAQPMPSGSKHTGAEASNPAELWLLPPQKGDGNADALSASPRPAPKPFFQFLSLSCFSEDRVVPEGEVARETFRVLVGLGALTEDGLPGPRMPAFRNAWVRNDRDWFHAQLLHSHPGYRNVTEQVRLGQTEGLKSRESQFLSLIRTLGQAARLPAASSPLRMGDAAVSFEQLDKALRAWLPQADAAIRIGEACDRAMEDLHLSPCRFELALSLLWERQRDYPIEPRTGGEPDRMASESVVEFRADGTHVLRLISPSTLTFGGAVPVLFLARHR